MDEQQPRQVFYPAMRFFDGERAIRWLTDVFGFEEKASYCNDKGEIMHAEMRFGGALMFFGQERESDYPVKPPSEGVPATGSVYVAVPPEEIDAHYERTKRAGARIFRELCDTEYGSREYSVYDCEGHPWSFGTYRP
jgi:uncharacterized glyoxalase superfamily protein PhnB